jgi:hypothetical protein
MSSPPRSSRNRRRVSLSTTGARVVTGSPAQLARSFVDADRTLRGSAGRGAPGLRPPSRWRTPTSPPRGRTGRPVAAPMCPRAEPGPCRGTSPRPGDPRIPLLRQEGGELGLPPWTAGEMLAQHGCHHRHLERVVVVPRGPKPPLASAAPDGLGQQRVVGCRNHVDGGPHQGRLDHRPPLEGPCQRFPPEVVEARPQPDVRGGRVLALKAPDSLERPGHRKLRPLQQEPAAQQRPVELTSGQDPIAQVGATDQRRPASMMR